MCTFLSQTDAGHWGRADLEGNPCNQCLEGKLARLTFHMFALMFARSPFRGRFSFGRHHDDCQGSHRA